MPIYFRAEAEMIPLPPFLDSPDVPAHEKIGAVFARSVGSLETFRELAPALGIAREDEDAVRQLHELMQSLRNPNLECVPFEKTGVFYVRRYSPADREVFENVAVFKIGRKRAEMETWVRRFAHLLGLPAQMIPGMLCAVQNAPIHTRAEVGSDSSESEATVEELWNGKEKIYLRDAGVPTVGTDDPWAAFDEPEFSDPVAVGEGTGESVYSDPKADSSISDAEEAASWSSGPISEDLPVFSTAKAVVGIVEPFLAPQPDASMVDFTLMTILALAIGLRDGKSDGYIGRAWLDVDDCMPIRIDPVWTKREMSRSPSAIDLPYLGTDPHAKQSLSPEEVDHLAELVSRWNIAEIVDQLRQQQIRYFGSAAERLRAGDQAMDEGGNRIEIAEQDPPHAINGRLNHLDPEKNPDLRLFLPEQLDACITRLMRIRDHIVECAATGAPLSPVSLCHAVDKYSALLDELLRRSPLSRAVDQTVDAGGSFAVTGRQSPKRMGVEIPESAIASLSSPTSPVGGVEPMGQIAHPLARYADSAEAGASGV